MADLALLPAGLQRIAPIVRQAHAAERHLALADAERLLEEALSLLHERHDVTAVKASLLASLGRVCAGQSKLSEAALHLEASLRHHRSQFGEKHMMTAKAHHQLGCLYTLQAKPNQSLKHLEDALVVYEAQGPEPSPDVADVLLDLGETCMGLGEPHQALDAIERAKAEFKLIGGLVPENRGYTRALFASGLILEEAGDWQAAKMALGSLVDLMAHSPTDSPLLVDASLHLSNVQLCLRETEDAIGQLETLMWRLRKERGTGHLDIVKVFIKLATAHMRAQQPNFASARAVLKAGLASARKVGPAAGQYVHYMTELLQAVEQSAAQAADGPKVTS